ncbi:MAG: PA0069 family radical SAM protein [Alphaproteobacteria bacterium]|nr:PA0069 family radical SAM protein [Alphaproteobacteria bacterium]
MVTVREFTAQHGIGRGAVETPTATRKMARGRGARTNVSGRFESNKRLLFDDGWQTLDDQPALKTEVFEEQPKGLINRNSSPDLGFDLSVNPYRGCEHGCSYCYARPAHAYVGLSPGLDFESKLFAKPNAAEVLRRELSAPGYKPSLIVLGGNTDAYQPIERRYRITRQILEVLLEFNNPIGIVTKSALVLRDLDILQAMAEKDLVNVAISVTSLDGAIARKMEPRAATPMKRMQALEVLAASGIPTTVMVAPVVPAINDSEIEAILKAASAAGVKEAGYIILRLPLELRELFREWLQSEFPDRAAHVLSLLKSMREGKDYDPTFGKRMKGVGPYAWSIGRRFEVMAKRLGLNEFKRDLRTDLFERPPQPGDQLSLL